MFLIRPVSALAGGAGLFSPASATGGMPLLNDIKLLLHDNFLLFTSSLPPASGRAIRTRRTGRTPPVKNDNIVEET
jgi:hypothetical protein